MHCCFVVFSVFVHRLYFSSSVYFVFCCCPSFFFHLCHSVCRNDRSRWLTLCIHCQFIWLHFSSRVCVFEFIRSHFLLLLLLSDWFIYSFVRVMKVIRIDYKCNQCSSCSLWTRKNKQYTYTHMYIDEKRDSMIFNVHKQTAANVKLSSVFRIINKAR